jgi:hypothetical protein
MNFYYIFTTPSLRKRTFLPLIIRILKLFYGFIAVYKSQPQRETFLIAYFYPDTISFKIKIETKEIKKA